MSDIKKLVQILYYFLRTLFLRISLTKKTLPYYHKIRLNLHLNWLRKNSQYYREHEAPFDQLPIMNKQEMMENFDEINTRSLDKQTCLDLALKSERERDFSSDIGDVSIGLSSGTSGSRGLFCTSPTEQNAWVGIILAKLLPNALLEKTNVALFLRANNNLYENVSSKKVKFRFFDLLDPIENYIYDLEKYAPNVMVGPPSLLRMIAQRVEQGVIKLKPSKIISGAEVLDPLDEAYLERVFEQKIHQIYQCTEGFLGHTCEHGTIHLNEDFLIIEKKMIDKKKFIPVITDLERKTQPIVRYELNDILTLKTESCPCGSPYTALEKIEGRCDDLFYYFSKNKKEDVKVLFPDFVRRRVIISDESIEEYKISQINFSDMRISVKPYNDAIISNINNSLKELFRELCAMDISLVFEPYHFEQRGMKLKRVQRDFSLWPKRD